MSATRGSSGKGQGRGLDSDEKPWSDSIDEGWDEVPTVVPPAAPKSSAPKLPMSMETRPPLGAEGELERLPPDESAEAGGESDAEAEWSSASATVRSISPGSLGTPTSRLRALPEAPPGERRVARTILGVGEVASATPAGEQAEPAAETLDSASAPDGLSASAKVELAASFESPTARGIQIDAKVGRRSPSASSAVDGRAPTVEAMTVRLKPPSGERATPTAGTRRSRSDGGHSGQGPSNLVLAVRWIVAAISVGLAVVLYFVK